jgi:hypothetical protein
MSHQKKLLSLYVTCYYLPSTLFFRVTCTVRARHFVVECIRCNHIIIKTNLSTSRSSLYIFLTHTQCVAYVHLRYERPGNIREFVTYFTYL